MDEFASNGSGAGFHGSSNGGMPHTPQRMVPAPLARCGVQSPLAGNAGSFALSQQSPHHGGFGGTQAALVADKNHQQQQHRERQAALNLAYNPSSAHHILAHPLIDPGVAEFVQPKSQTAKTLLDMAETNKTRAASTSLLEWENRLSGACVVITNKIQAAYDNDLQTALDNLKETKKKYDNIKEAHETKSQFVAEAMKMIVEAQSSTLGSASAMIFGMDERPARYVILYTCCFLSFLALLDSLSTSFFCNYFFLTAGKCVLRRRCCPNSSTTMTLRMSNHRLFASCSFFIARPSLTRPNVLFVLKR